MKRALIILLGAAAVTMAVFSAHDLLFRTMGAAEVIRKLQGLRMAVELFRQDKGRLPAGMNEVILNGTLEAVPELKLKRHTSSVKVRNTARMEILDTGRWSYVNEPGSPDFGTVFIDCSHKDEKGRFWSEF